MLAGYEDGKICNWDEHEEIVMPYLTQRRAHPGYIAIIIYTHLVSYLFVIFPIIIIII